MSRQDKATTERHTKTLRELLKRPENKFCADCKRNDPRWASWNLGLFLCIRCSGIHRSMGTHISKVKSVDLDVWTPEQMASIQKWGNRLANLYWEAHLKPGHVPPDHKMESFIRSKYESRRWAREGPPPSDPSTLDDGSGAQQAASLSAPSFPAPSSNESISRSTHAPSGSVSSARGQPLTNRQPQPHQLLSTSVANRASQPTVAPAQPQQPLQQPAPAPVQTSAANDLFTLDFHNPTPPANAPPQPKKDVKQDILSLFSTQTAAPQTQAPGFGAATNAFGQFNALQTQPTQNAWGAPLGATAAQPTTFMGNAGVGLWGASSGWNSTPAAAQPQSNLWGSAQPQVAQQQQPQQMFNTNDIWASNGGAGAGGSGGPDLFGSSSLGNTQKKNDAFGDLWGGFK
ncbi:hypothetical protein BXZ70DRAFT_933821 [Cristinia sonorae]|uniref:Arf-GAP domain-containing protein n=1 Tax=Cristinia sonorae TaxID=1940300 RepID=A0A8K0XQQ2_9AGAR|nr:hypothetical protein BXZ70DRAFT_933821 [Cristinia sonorae]